MEAELRMFFDVTKEFHALLLKLLATASALAVVFVVDWRALSAPMPPPASRAGGSCPHAPWRMCAESNLNYSAEQKVT